MLGAAAVEPHEVRRQLLIDIRQHVRVEGDEALVVLERRGDRVDAGVPGATIVVAVEIADQLLLRRREVAAHGDEHVGRLRVRLELADVSIDARVGERVIGALVGPDVTAGGLDRLRVVDVVALAVQPGARQKVREDLRAAATAPKEVGAAELRELIGSGVRQRRRASIEDLVGEGGRAIDPRERDARVARGDEHVGRRRAMAERVRQPRRAGVRAERVLGEPDAVEVVTREQLGLGQQRIGARHPAADDPPAAGPDVCAHGVELLGVDLEVMLEKRHLGHAVVSARLLVEDLARGDEQIADEQRVVVVESVLPVDVEVRFLTEHDHARRIGRDPELGA